MKFKRFFISGGAGVIGSELVPRLVAQGADVLVGDLKPRPQHFPASVNYRQGDLNTINQAEIDAFAPEVFIHLAATFERSIETEAFWEENFWHNLRLSHYLMTAIKQCRSIRRVVFASSYLIYDPALYQFTEPQPHPFSLKENDSILPRNLTGMAKLAHEIELRFIDTFYSQHFSTVCARIYRGYGRNSRDVISRWIRMLLQDQPITVYQPEGLFDYIYAADTAEGLLRLSLVPEVTGIINLGTGRARRVQDVVNQLKTHFPDMQVHSEQNDQLYEASQADMSLFQQKIGWMPEYTLESAIPEMVAHERARMQQIAQKPAAPLNLLISSASRKVPLLQAAKKAAVRIKGDSQVIAGDMDSQALSASFANDFWQMPPTNDAHFEELLQGCLARNISMILPTRDSELLFWARHATELREAGIELLTSPATSIERCLDKLAFSQFGEKHQLPFIPSYLQPDASAIHWVVKERFGAGSRSLGLNLDRQAALNHAQQLEAPIFQPFIEGLEISVDAWLDRKHQVKGLVLRRRELVMNGESQITTTFREPAIEQQVQVLLEQLELSGPVVLQAIIDEQQHLHVIECNPRFGGASTASLAVGLDSLYWSMQEALEQDINLYPFTRLPDVTQVRAPQDFYQVI